MARKLWLAGVVTVVVLAGGWFLTGRVINKAAPSGGIAQVAAGSLDDLLMDLQLVPLDGQAPKPFALDSFDGRRVALADLKGKPALLYFWATW